MPDVSGLEKNLDRQVVEPRAVSVEQDRGRRARPAGPTPHSPRPKMLRYALTRIAIWIPTLLVVLMGVYALAFFGGGDPIKLIFLCAPGDVAYDPVRIEAIREEAGLNRPFLAQ